MTVGKCVRVCIGSGLGDGDLVVTVTTISVPQHLQFESVCILLPFQDISCQTIALALYRTKNDTIIQTTAIKVFVHVGTHVSTYMWTTFNQLCVL